MRKLTLVDRYMAEETAILGDDGQLMTRAQLIAYLKSTGAMPHTIDFYMFCLDQRKDERELA